jgi:hypothetical protein
MFEFGVKEASVDLIAAERELRQRRDGAVEALIKVLLEVSGPERMQNFGAYQAARDRLERIDHGLALLPGTGRAGS